MRFNKEKVEADKKLVIQFVTDHIDKYGYSPTYAVVVEQTGIGVSRVYKFLQRNKLMKRNIKERSNNILYPEYKNDMVHGGNYDDFAKGYNQAINDIKNLNK